MTDINFGLSDGDARSKRGETIRLDIRRRLKRVCAQYSEEEFFKLVDQMVERQLKGERRANLLPGFPAA
ncbi:MAG: hypothetical protein ABJB95_05075 [Gemmatimonadales bacterium]